MALTALQSRFIEEYLTCWNAALAARRAGYSARTARVTGPENLRKPAIREQIEQRLADKVMSADEALARLSEQASVNIQDFVTFYKYTDKQGKEYEGVRVDLKKAIRRGRGHLVKKISWSATGSLEIELYDAQSALRSIVAHHQRVGGDGDDWREQIRRAGGDPDQLYAEFFRQVAGINKDRR